MKQEEYRMAVRVQPFELITKIQQAKPTHLSTLINKELGYDAIVQQQVTIPYVQETNFFNGLLNIEKSKTTQEKLLLSTLSNTIPSFKNAGSICGRQNVPSKQQCEDQGKTEIVHQKIKNCICSARPNSQTFKRLSKLMLSNLKNRVNQIILFCSPPSERQYRIQSSIGTKSNPGVFLVSAISLLNEKYNNGKQISSFNYDIQISFSEMIDGHIYDLLNYTGQPLKVARNQNSSNDGKEQINGQKTQKTVKQQLFLHGQTFIKVSSFKQFIKLYKIALFNNKERDFKTSKSSHVSSNLNSNLNFKQSQSNVKQNDQGAGLLNKASSTFFMKIRSIVYDKNGELSYKQETTFIDFQNTQPKSSNLNNSKAKKTKTPVVSSANKTIWDYILVDLNNANTANKKLHYHLVQQNYLLQLLKKHLSNGQVTFVASFSANPKKLKQNLDFLNTIRNYSGLNSMQLNGSWQHKVYIKPFKRAQINWEYFEKQSKQILTEISKYNYTSIRELENLKAGCIKVLKKFNYWVKTYKNLLVKISQIKRDSKFLQNSNIADQIILIGSCVKSDHFKDFYNAKSHISLQRQVTIKTEAVRKEIKQLLEKYQTVLQNFAQVNQKQEKSAINWRKILQNCHVQKQKKAAGSTLSVGSNSSFQQTKALQSFADKNTVQSELGISGFILKLFDLSQQMLFFFQQMQTQMTQHNQRTIADEIIREQICLQEIENMNNFWMDFHKNLKAIGSTKNPISCQQQKIVINGTHFNLLKEMNKTAKRFSQLGLSIYSKQGQKENIVSKLGMSNQSCFFNKKTSIIAFNDDLIKRRFLRLPQIKQITENPKSIAQKLKQGTKTCQRSDQQSANVIKLSAFKISSMLIDPNNIIISNEINQNQQQQKKNIGHDQGLLKIRKVQSLIP